MHCLAVSPNIVTHVYLPAAETSELGCQTAESPRRVHDDSRSPQRGTEVAVVGSSLAKVINCPLDTPAVQNQQYLPGECNSAAGGLRSFVSWMHMRRGVCFISASQASTTCLRP